MYIILIEFKQIKMKKIMLVFDLCSTIIAGSTDYSTFDLLAPSIRQEMPEPWGPTCNWAGYTQKVYNRMKKEKITIEQIREKVIGIPLNEGFKDLFEYIRENNDTTRAYIVSGSNTLYIKWILDHHGIKDVFKDYYTLYAHPDESCLIKIRQHHAHDCDVCDRSICKRIVLKHLMENDKSNRSVLYVGDGDNDYCPGKILRPRDILLPRRDFYLYNMLFGPDQLIKTLKCRVHPWKSGRDIIKVIQKMI